MVYTYGVINYKLLMKNIKNALDSSNVLYDPASGATLIGETKRIRLDTDMLVKALQSVASDRLLTAPSNPPNLDIALSSLLSSIIPARGTVNQDLSSYSIAAGGSVDVDKNTENGWSSIVATLRVTYDASATDGVKMYWLYSPDGTNYDDEDDAEAQNNYIQPVFSAGQTKQVTVLIPILTPYIKIRIKNLDTNYAATVSLWTILIR